MGGPGPPPAPLPLVHIYMQDPGLQGPRNAATPHLEDDTPYSDDHAACWGCQHTHSSETRFWHSPQSTPSLAETWELSSLSRLACTPYYRHARCKIIQCPRTLPCWTYGPAAGISLNPCITVLPLASTSGTRKHAAFTSWDPDPRVRTPTVGAPGRGSLRDIFSLVPI